MARRPDFADPLAAIRGLLRDLRAARRLAVSPVAGKLCPGVPVEQRQVVILSTLRLALYRLPERQREILRRYDIGDEPAPAVQRALGLSSRQFFRDRRVALARLSAYLLGTEPPALSDSGDDGLSGKRRRKPKPAVRSPALAEPSRHPAIGNVIAAETELAPRTLARSLAQSGSSECLRVLWDLAHDVHEPAKRATVLLDLAEAALDFDDISVVWDAEHSATKLVDALADPQHPHNQYLLGRLERVRARLATSRLETIERFDRATLLLRRSADATPDHMDARWALAETLGDLALQYFGNGAFAQARAASSEATNVIDDFELWSRPRALEVLAMDATLSACLSGVTAHAIDLTQTFLARAVDSGWCATACRLGADLIGLNAIRGDYEEAIRWYRRMAASPSFRARPADRSNIAMETAHAFTMMRRPSEALQMLGNIRPGNGCPGSETPDWHAFASAACERAGEDAAALEHARLALAGYCVQQTGRGIGDAHRLIAISAWKLGDLRTAQEHIVEAQRLVEAYGTPYGVLRTLVARATIVQTPAVKREAIELARLLLKLGKGQDAAAG